MRHSNVGALTDRDNNAKNIIFPLSTISYPLLPPQTSPKKTLVLDLDETLIHSSPTIHGKVLLSLRFIQNEKSNLLHVLLRPGAKEFINKVAELFEIVIFTASQKRYADCIIDRLDPGKFVKHRLYREHCVSTHKGFIKDLSLLGRDLKSVVIVDNSPLAYEWNSDNAIPIETWTYREDDRNLEKVFKFLKELHQVEDVRKYLAKPWENGDFNYEKIIERIRFDQNQNLNKMKILNTGNITKSSNYNLENSRHESGIRPSKFDHNILRTDMERDINEYKKYCENKYGFRTSRAERSMDMIYNATMDNRLTIGSINDTKTIKYNPNYNISMAYKEINRSNKNFNLSQDMNEIKNAKLEQHLPKTADSNNKKLPKNTSYSMKCILEEKTKGKEGVRNSTNFLYGNKVKSYENEAKKHSNRYNNEVCTANSLLELYSKPKSISRCEGNKNGIPYETKETNRSKENYKEQMKTNEYKWRKPLGTKQSLEYPSHNYVNKEKPKQQDNYKYTIENKENYYGKDTGINYKISNLRFSNTGNQAQDRIKSYTTRERTKPSNSIKTNKPHSINENTKYSNNYLKQIEKPSKDVKRSNYLETVLTQPKETVSILENRYHYNALLY